MEHKYMMMYVSQLNTSAPFSDLFRMKESALDEITYDMKKNGFDKAHPIVIWAGHNSTVIDGHTRLACAKRAGLMEVAAVAHDFEDELEALEYAIKAQRNRRNLTDAEIAACLSILDEKKKIGRPSKDTLVKVVPGRSSRTTAELLGTSATKIEKMRTINSFANPEIKQAFNEGKMTVNKAYDETMKERRAEERCLPEYDPQDVKNYRMEILEKEIIHVATNRIYRELRENPEIQYTPEELNELISNIQEKIPDVIRMLPKADEEYYNEN